MMQEDKFHDECNDKHSLFPENNSALVIITVLVMGIFQNLPKITYTFRKYIKHYFGNSLEKQTRHTKSMFLLHLWVY